MTSKFKSTALCALCAIGAAGTAARAEQTIDQRLPADMRGAVLVSMTAGKVDCIGWDKAEVEITGELAGDAERLDVQREGNTINIRVLKKSPSVHWISETRLTVKMPASNGLRISSVSADASVAGINGEQRLQTVSGDVDSAVAAADVEVKSLSGDVKIQGKGAKLHLTLSTVSGTMNVRQVAGDLDLDTVSGDVNIDMAEADRVRLKSISAEMVAAGTLGHDARVDASSVSGDMKLRWLGSEAANVNAESFSGDISACFGNVPVIRANHGPGQSWQYQPPNSSADIHAKSLSGDIVMCNK